MFAIFIFKIILYEHQIFFYFKSYVKLKIIIGHSNFEVDTSTKHKMIGYRFNFYTGCIN